MAADRLALVCHAEIGGGLTAMDNLARHHRHSLRKLTPAFAQANGELSRDPSCANLRIGRTNYWWRWNKCGIPPGWVGARGCWLALSWWGGMTHGATSAASTCAASAEVCLGICTCSQPHRYKFFENLLRLLSSCCINPLTRHIPLCFLCLSNLFVLIEDTHQAGCD